MKTKIKTFIAFFLAAAMLLGLGGCGSQISKTQKDKISVYLWSVDLMDEYAPYIQSQLPDVEIEFVVGNNDLDFYKFLEENGALPDIITSRRFSLNDAKDLEDSLLDLSTSEEAGSIYLSYLESYTNSDGTVNWLPLCGEVDGFIANKALFDKYSIPLPTDYDSFVAACRAFEEHGIRGFVSDFCYDYTCMEILQGLSIPQLTSLKGIKWRHAYEDPTNEENGLDSAVWPGVFRRMEQFIQDAKLMPEDVTLSYDPVDALFREEKAAVIRGTGAIAMELRSEGCGDPVLLPYFGENGEDWLLTYPSFQVALNKDLEQDPKRKEYAFRVLNVMLSEEGQNILSQKKDVISYNKGVELQLAEELSNLKPYIESNHLYIRLASDDFFSVSKDVVQKMILGEYDAEQAYKEFDSKLRRTKDATVDTAASFDCMYPYEFRKKGGNPAASAMANTLRKYYEADLLIAPAYSFTGSILRTDYSEKMVKYMIMPNSLEAYLREMTGAEVRALLKASVEGVEGSGFAPFNQFSLPVLSGASMEVKEKNGKYTLTHVLVHGKELEDAAVYKVAYLNTYNYYSKIVPQLYPEQGEQTFETRELGVRDAWIAYIREGNTISMPADYIVLK